jgi:hypothetical protein
VPDEVENCVDCLIMTVDGCMLGQQQYEIQHVRKNNLYNGPNQQIMGAMNPTQQQFMAQGKPPQQQSMGTAAAMGAGMMVGGAAGGMAAHQAMGGGKQKPPPQQFGQPMYGQPQPGYGQPQYGQPQQAYRGFLATAAPNGQPWGAYCQMQQAFVTPQGYVGGPWGECIAWSKIFEFQNPGAIQDPQYEGGPTGQVIQFLVDNAPGNMKQKLEQAADKLEEACDQCGNSGRPLPIINATP